MEELDKSPEYMCVDCRRFWSEYDIYGGEKPQKEDEEPVCPDCAGELTGLPYED